MYGFVGLDECGLCRSFHRPGHCGACCVPWRDADVMPYGTGTGGSDICEDVIALRRTGLNPPVNCVNGAACTGVPWEQNACLGGPFDEDSSLRTGLTGAYYHRPCLICRRCLLMDRWFQVLWLAVFCDARGGACGSSN